MPGILGSDLASELFKLQCSHKFKVILVSAD